MGWENHWHKQASQILKAELMRRGVTYKQLMGLLPRVGGLESEASITAKLARGRFQFAFFLQCMRAIGVQTAHIDILGLQADSLDSTTVQTATLNQSPQEASHRKRVEAAVKEAAKSDGK